MEKKIERKEQMCCFVFCFHLSYSLLFRKSALRNICNYYFHLHKYKYIHKIILGKPKV